MRYFLSHDGSSVQGPYVREQLLQWLSDGTIQPSTQICAESGTDWLPASSLATKVPDIGISANALLVSDTGMAKGAYTKDQIYSMWKSGALSAQAKFFDRQGDEWVDISSVIETFKPASALAKTLGLVRTEEEKQQDRLSANRGCAHITLVFGALCLMGAYTLYVHADDATVSEEYFEQEIRPFAKPKERPTITDLLYDPQAAQKYQEAKAKAMFPLVKKTKTRNKTPAETIRDTWTAAGLGLLGALLILGSLADLRRFHGGSNQK